VAHDPGFVSSNRENEQEDAFALAANALKSRPEDRYSAALNHISTLPTRIAEILGRSENMPDVMAILRSIAILVNCCVSNFASDKTEDSFMTMATWLVKVPDRFHQMVADSEPAALILVAHWAAFLVKRAECCGCWFLGDSAEMILLHVTHQVSDNFAILRLIEELQSL
jgi:hypothetical protein